MNRITSILAGTVTAALSGAVVAAAAVGQGVFDGQPTKPAPKAVEAQQTQTWKANATAAAAAQSTPELVAQQPQQRIVYVDKEPIIMTRTIQQPAPNDSAQSAAAESPTTAPTTTNTTTATTDAKTPEKTKTPE